MGEEMPDLSLKLPNLTAEISWSWRIRDSIGGGGEGEGLVGGYRLEGLSCRSATAGARESWW